MLSKKTINLDGIPITFYKSKRAKNINISIRPFVGVRVAVPRFATYRQAHLFVHSRKLWIKKHTDNMTQYENRQTVFDWNTVFKTKTHQLNLVKSKIEVINYKITDNQLIINIPERRNIAENSVQIAIQKAVENTYRLEAKNYLPNRVHELASKHRLTYKKVKINNAKTRWGSCSGINNINLTLQLMRLPNHLIDYVILHELAHTNVKNHSVTFWNFLDTLTDNNAKKLDKELKTYYLNVF